jgi:hypothetical protein
MKKIFVSAGIAAIGAMSLHADEYAPDVTAVDASKIWSVSGTLRGFYDDNINTAPNGQKEGSGGFEFSPALSLILPLQQTELGLRYTYGLYYYQQRENQGSNPIDQSHQVNLWIDHAFTERWEGKVQDTFTSQQDPQLSSTPTALPYRTEGNNIQNVATASVHTEWTMLFSDDLGYQNTLVYYQQHGATEASITANPGGATYAGLLNQDGNSIYLNLNYQYLPDLSFLVGYQFGLVNYIGNEPIALNPLDPAEFYFSNSRDQYSHTLYAGGQYTAIEDLSLSVQAGFQYSDNYNLPSFDTQSPDSYQPYASIALTYNYLQGDYAQVGFTQSESSSATADPNAKNGSLTLYSEASVFYASINHQITPNLLASVIGHYQYSTYVSGNNNGQPQNWYSFGLNLSYAFNPYISAEAGYNFDYLTAAGPLAGYSRNQVYLGVTATY